MLGTRLRPFLPRCGGRLRSGVPLALSLLALFIPSDPARGQTPVPVGDEYVVIDNLDFQAGRSVAVDREGNAVVYWYQFFGGYSARGDAAGGQLLPVFDIEPYAPAESTDPYDAIALDVGEFALLREVGGETLEFHRHNLDGSAQSAFPVVEASDPETGFVVTPAISPIGGTVFVVGWTEGKGIFWDQTDVFYRFFNLAGATSDVFPMNTLTSGEQSYPELVAHADGTLLAVWRSQGSEGTDNDGFSVQARLFPPVGTPGDQFQVNTTEVGDQSAPDVAAGADGSFLVVWHGLAEGGRWLNIWAQLIGSDGAKIGSEVRLSADRSGSQRLPRVVPYEGGYLVVWTLYTREIGRAHV